MTYQEALTYMFQALPMFHRQGKSAYKKDLTNVRLLCNALGNPENNFRSIHIAGTNGKGSVSHMLSAVLQKHGYKTGLYISPHYIDYRERIKVNGEYISKNYVRHFIEKNRSLLDEIQPSFFEMTVALAFHYFSDQGVDLAVIETGLGGRLDSTNILHPILSIITNISWDHADMLGDSFEKIAIEKAGIIKNHTPALIGRIQNETLPVFQKNAAEKHAPLFTAEQLIPSFHCDQGPLGLAKVQYNAPMGSGEFQPGLTGIYQEENIRTALAACALLQQACKLPLKSSSIHEALSQVVTLTRIMGRWQILQNQPLLICESAHNEDGIAHLMRQIENIPFLQLHLVCGFVKDKDLARILNQFPKHARYYFVQAKIPRAMPAQELLELAKTYQLFGKANVSVKRGLSQALRNANPEDLILVSGSIFVVGEVLEKYSHLKN